MPLSPSRALCGALMLLVPVLAGAQPSGESSDSLPFRAGQWGAEFQVRDGTGLSALRFRDVDRAWIGTVSGELLRADADRFDQRRYLATVQLGHRWYRPSARRAITPFWALGVGGSLFRDRRETQLGTGPSPTAVIDDSSIALGAFGEVGAQWLVTPRLALGAAWQLGATRQRIDSERVSASPPIEPARTIYSVRAEPVALRATLYF